MQHNTPENVSVQPIGDRLLIRKIEPKKTTVGGLWIPDTAQNPTMLAEVLSVGAGRLHDRPVAEHVRYLEDPQHPGGSLGSDITHEFRPPPVQPGDFILHGRFAGHEVEVNQVTYHILREEEVLAIVRGDGLREWVASQEDEEIPEPEGAPV